MVTELATPSGVEMPAEEDNSSEIEMRAEQEPPPVDAVAMPVDAVAMPVDAINAKPNEEDLSEMLKIARAATSKTIERVDKRKQETKKTDSTEGQDTSEKQNARFMAQKSTRGMQGSQSETNLSPTTQGTLLEKSQSLSRLGKAKKKKNRWNLSAERRAQSSARGASDSESDYDREEARRNSAKKKHEQQLAHEQAVADQQREEISNKQDAATAAKNVQLDATRNRAIQSRGRSRTPTRKRQPPNTSPPNRRDTRLGYNPYDNNIDQFLEKSWRNTRTRGGRLPLVSHRKNHKYSFKNKKSKRRVAKIKYKHSLRKHGKKNKRFTAKKSN